MSLQKLAKTGKLEGVNTLLENGAEINKKILGRTPLYSAAGKGHTNVIKSLLEHGAAVDVPCYHQETALHQAAYKNHFEALDILLDAGANPNLCDEYGHTPLMRASSNGNVPSVTRLIQYGAKINAQTKNGWSALHYALLNNRVDVALLLINAGADPMLKIKSCDKTSVDMARQSCWNPCPNDQTKKLYSTLGLRFSNNNPHISQAP